RVGGVVRGHLQEAEPEDQRDPRSGHGPEDDCQGEIEQQDEHVVDQVEGVHRQQPQHRGPAHQVEDLRDLLRWGPRGKDRHLHHREHDRTQGRPAAASQEPPPSGQTAQTGPRSLHGPLAGTFQTGPRHCGFGTPPQPSGPADPAAYSCIGTSSARHAASTGSTMRQLSSATSPRIDSSGSPSRMRPSTSPYGSMRESPSAACSSFCSRSKGSPSALIDSDRTISAGLSSRTSWSGTSWPCSPVGTCAGGLKKTSMRLAVSPSALPLRSRNGVPRHRALSMPTTISASVSVFSSGSTPSSAT